MPRWPTSLTWSVIVCREHGDIRRHHIWGLWAWRKGDQNQKPQKVSSPQQTLSLALSFRTHPLSLSFNIDTSPTFFSSFLCRRTIVCLFHYHQKKRAAIYMEKETKSEKIIAHCCVRKKSIQFCDYQVETGCQSTLVWLSGWDRAPVNTCVTIRLRQGVSQHLCDYEVETGCQSTLVWLSVETGCQSTLVWLSVETGCQSTLVWLSGWDRVPVNTCVTLWDRVPVNTCVTLWDRVPVNTCVTLSGWDGVPVNTCVTIRLRQGASQHLCDYQFETGCQTTFVFHCLWVFRFWLCDCMFITHWCLTFDWQTLFKLWLTDPWPSVVMQAVHQLPWWRGLQEGIWLPAQSA